MRRLILILIGCVRTIVSGKCGTILRQRQAAGGGGRDPVSGDRDLPGGTLCPGHWAVSGQWAVTGKQKRIFL